MNTAFFRLYASLNDFLPPAQRGHYLCYAFQGAPSVKDSIEAIGVPHPEVDLILINGTSADFCARLASGDQVSVFPRFHSFPVGECSRVRPPDLDEVRFILDVHLGRLAELLRLFGFDVEYENEAADEDLAQSSFHQNRVLLTRDRGLLKRSEVRYGYCVRSLDPQSQIVEILHRYHLWDAVQPFRRCMICNGVIEPVPREEVLDELLPGTRRAFEQFYRCDKCQKVYWRGSHVDELQAWIDSVLDCRSSAGEKS